MTKQESFQAAHDELSHCVDLLLDWVDVLVTKLERVNKLLEEGGEKDLVPLLEKSIEQVKAKKEQVGAVADAGRLAREAKVIPIPQVPMRTHWTEGPYKTVPQDPANFKLEDDFYRGDKETK